MQKKEFAVLNEIYKNGYSNQRELAKNLGYSLGKTNALLSGLKEQNYLDNEMKLTDCAINALKPYKVDNAIIMAAGMASRFAPLSYEKPKGLLIVKGEVLIERQICQLQQAGITDITIVVGYMKEAFFYLKDKFNVDIVINEDYYRYNNTSTLLLVENKLKNTYICSSDDYFTENVFEPYVYSSYYSGIYVDGESDEYGINTDKSGRIKSIDYHAKDMWVMLGHVYFTNDFSNRFKKILSEEFQIGNTKYELWENLLNRHLNELEIYLKKYPDGIIYEFDSLDELRNFDDRYLENSGSEIFKNICSTLKCSEKDITNISVMSKGLTNLSFKFDCNSQTYVYRHPGQGTSAYISRKSEAFSMKCAYELGLDKTIIKIDGEKGWKISKYIKNARELDYYNNEEVSKAIEIIRKLHNAKIKSDYDFDIWKKTLELIDRIHESKKSFDEFGYLFSKMTDLYELTKKDDIEHILCHCDCYSPNFLFDDENNISLIDWEYSGNDDPANDLGTFICCSPYGYDEALKVFDIYYGRKPSSFELRHNIAYVAIASYYWYIWAIYQESIGNAVGDYLLLWYNNTKTFMKKAFEMYKEN